MIQKPKIKVVLNKKDKGLLYFFESRAQFDACVARGCKLISSENARDVSDFILSMDLISTLSIELWRLDKRIENANNTQKLDSSIIDQIQRIRDIFRKQEIEIKPHTGDDYNDGMTIKALDFEEVDNIPAGKMKVIETVKPSIYFKGKIISHGEVLVGKSKEKGVNHE